MITKTPWFSAKRFGYGWGLPATWQGWVVFITYILFLVSDFLRRDQHSHSNSDTIRPFLIDMIIATVIFIVVVYITSGKPTHHWNLKTLKDKKKKE